MVGGGFGSSFQWHQHPNCMVHAVSDLRDDRRNRLMNTYKCDRTYDSLGKLILDKEIEAVAVFTGAPDHVRHSVAVMNTGKHVICAVPAAMNLEECEQLLEAKKRNQRKYMMAETSYYNYHAIAARQLFNQGKFGELFYSEVEYYHPILDKERDYYWWRNGKPTWRHGYVPMLYPTHSTGYLVGVTRERLTEVSCLGWGDPNDTDLKDNQYHNPFNVQVALMKTDEGNVCRCNICYIGTARGERAQWFGSKLAYYMPGSGGQPFKIQGKDAPNWKEVPRFWERLPEFLRHETGHGGSHSFLTHEFIAALVEDREPAIDIYESLAMNAPGIVAHQSALKGGEQLKIPQYDDRIV
ncbi:MAG: Gfo/Idh/MocA family oxidoreductase [Planctomycetota bacterium]|nr:MAG: Gfo/Idh/MocA family oxidoreductase [Planctomycetota bacterium]